MHILMLHPDCPVGAVHAITASIEPTDSGCRATFVASGEMQRIIIPQVEAPGRFDNLWQTTCFEIFWQTGPSSYREFNLSPSTRWACYDFDGFRQGMRDAPAQVEISIVSTASELKLVAEISSELPLPSRVALNGIIKDAADGQNRFWALNFADGKPEFHSEVCRAVLLEAKV